MRRLWYFDVSVWSVDKKPYHSGLCQNSVFTPYCKDWDLIYPHTYSSASNFHEYHSDTPRPLSDSSQTPPRYPQGTWNANRQQQMPRNTARLSQTAPVSFLGSLGMSVGVCWHFMFHRDAMGLSGECLGGVWVNLSWIHGNWRCTNVFGGWVLNPCSMGWKHYYGTALNSTVFCQLTILTQYYWDIKITKPPHKGLPKMFGLCHFLWFLGSSERYYLLQLLLITLYNTQYALPSTLTFQDSLVWLH